MARICYSVNGEGRGHATRVRATVEELRSEHEVTLFLCGDAHELLAPVYEGAENVRVVRLPGLRFAYRGSHRLDYPATALRARQYLVNLPKLVGALARRLEAERPDLVVTDFEPALPRAARKVGVPFASFDHQHFLTNFDLSGLPTVLRWYASFLAPFVSAFYRGQVRTIVSSFYRAPVKKGCEDTVVTGVILRPEIQNARADHGDHLLVYLRRLASPRILDTLRDCGREVLVYGLGERAREGNLVYRPISNHGFVRDLAGCEALVCTAGNQLVGEALHLGKPILAFPEDGNFEQAINGHFLKASGAGDCVNVADFNGRTLNTFLERIDEFRAAGPIPVNGNHAAVEAIRSLLPRPRPQPRRLGGEDRERRLETCAA
jgi:uncharacterized protein (TIGR00661 family)